MPDCIFKFPPCFSTVHSILDDPGRGKRYVTKPNETSHSCHISCMPSQCHVSYRDFTRVALASVPLTEECNSNLESAACGAGSLTQEGTCGIAVRSMHVAMGIFYERCSYIPTQPYLPGLSSACRYLCRFAFTRPLVHCGGDGPSTTRVPRMVVVFLWFCLYVPCTGYTVSICRERIYGVKSEINFIFTKARGCSRALRLRANDLSEDHRAFHSTRHQHRLDARPAGKELLLKRRLF